MLGEKIDYIARATTGGGAGADVISTLDQRVSAIADALGERVLGGTEGSPRLEALMQSLGEKIEQIQTSRGDTGAVSHLEQRIASLVDRLDASQSRLGQLETIERGLNDLLAHMEEMRASKAADGAQDGQAPAVADLKVNMDRTQDALEAVHDTLGHVVDRLAMIEKEFRNKERRIVPDVGEADLAPGLPADLPPSIGRLAVRAVSQAPAEPHPPGEGRARAGRACGGRYSTRAPSRGRTASHCDQNAGAPSGPSGPTAPRTSFTGDRRMGRTINRSSPDQAGRNSVHVSPPRKPPWVARCRPNPPPAASQVSSLRAPRRPNRHAARRSRARAARRSRA